MMQGNKSVTAGSVIWVTLCVFLVSAAFGGFAALRSAVPPSGLVDDPRNVFWEPKDVADSGSAADQAGRIDAAFHDVKVLASLSLAVDCLAMCTLSVVFAIRLPLEPKRGALVPLFCSAVIGGAGALVMDWIVHRRLPRSTDSTVLGYHIPAVDLLAIFLFLGIYVVFSLTARRMLKPRDNRSWGRRAFALLTAILVAGQAFLLVEWLPGPPHFPRPLWGAGSSASMHYTRQMVLPFSTPINKTSLVGSLLSFNDGLTRIPGIVSASESLTTPMGGGAFPINIQVWGGSSQTSVMAQGVGPGYFKAVGIEVLQGREFDNKDFGGPSGIQPMIIDSRIGDRFAPAQDATGLKLTVPGSGEYGVVVGVVRSIRGEATTSPLLYVPLINTLPDNPAQTPLRIVVASLLQPSAVGALLQEQLQADLPQAALGQLRGLRNLVLLQDQIGLANGYMVLLGSFMAISLLAGAGVVSLRRTPNQDEGIEPAYPRGAAPQEGAAPRRLRGE